MPTMPPRIPSIACALLCAVGSARAENARNPVIWADVPDISIIRAGDTYYMSSTTMHMSPGVPIMKSADLVNWDLVSYAYDTLVDNEAMRLEDGQNAYGAGSWASSLRFHNGTYYVSTFSATSGKTHVYSTTDIEKGPWEESSFGPALHDHSLFFDDDGKVYMLHGGNNLRLTELEKDTTGIKAGGFDDVVIHDASLVAGPEIGLPAGGSQMFKVNGNYYVINIAWPPGGMRTALVHRADKITGPYEGRVLLHDMGVAQGGLVDTPDGKWYAYLFKDNGPVGRIPYLVPVTWQDGWPVAGVDGKVPMELNIPAGTQGASGASGIVASDEFNRKPGDVPLPLAWQWNHNPVNENWSLAERPGALRLKTIRVDASLLEARNTLTQRTFGPQCAAETRIDLRGMNDGDVAGLCVLQKKYGYVGVKVEGARKSLVMVSAASDSPQEIASVPLERSVVHMKIECDFRPGADKARFFYSLDGKTWEAIGESLQMVYTLPHFMGYRFGLFNFATKAAGGYADFDYFRLSDGTHR